MSGSSDGLSYSLAELAEIVGGQVHGASDLVISGVSDLRSASEGDISFVAGKDYLGELKTSGASAVVVPAGIEVDRPAIIVDRVELTFAQLLELYAPPTVHPSCGIHETAVVETAVDQTVAIGANAYVGPGTTIGRNTVIYPNVYVGPEVVIGCDCVIYSGTVIRERISIGERVIIHPNATIGSDGFGYNLVDGRHVKVRHIGTVVIEDDVELGACVCVDRAKTGATRIGAGTKVDNLVQIGHNVKIGRNSILVAQVGIGGSTVLGQYVVLGGKVGVRDHVTIGDGVRAAAYCAVSKDIPAKLTINGIPAIDHREHLRQQVHVRRLGQTNSELAELVKRVAELEQTVHNLKRSGT